MGLLGILKRTISVSIIKLFIFQSKGPITLAEYMENCLFHPEFGYYCKSGPIFGRRGDFITAPEMGQLFGEMIGVFIQNYAAKLSNSFNVVELGPGNGTLASDILGSIKNTSHAGQLLDKYILVERSIELQKIQKTLLKNLPVVFVNELDPIQGGPHSNVIIANEFFDALPIHLLQVINLSFIK